MTLGQAAYEVLSQLYRPIKPEIAELFEEHQAALQLIWYCLNYKDNVEIFYVRNINETLGINQTLYDVLPVWLSHYYVREWTEYIFNRIAKSHVKDCDGLYIKIIFTENKDIVITLHISNWKISREYQKIIII